MSFAFDGIGSYICMLFEQVQIEEAIDGNRLEELKKMSEECGIALDDVDKTVKPIIESCTKDAILVLQINSIPQA